MILFRKKSLLIGSCLLVLSLFIAACGSNKSVKGGELPTLGPTDTARPHATSTPIPAPEVSRASSVDWTDLTAHYQAMRTEFASDIDDWADGSRYYIEANVELNETAAVITGSQRTRFVNQKQDVLDSVAFRLYANLPRMVSQLRIVDVTIGDQPANYELMERNSTLMVYLDEELGTGDSVEIAIEFMTVLERGAVGSYGQSGYSKDLLVLPGWHPTLSVYEDGTGWWVERPAQNGDELYGETALYELYVTHAENIVLAMSGLTVDEVTNADGTVTEHVVSGPMRYSLITASTTIGKLSDEVDGVTVNVFYFPGDERGAEWALQVGVDSVEVFNREFGDYPYAELDIMETYNFAGIEYPGIVVITENSWTNGSLGLETVVAHEVAHQWWYGLVGNNQIRSPWLDESLTTFSETVYFREVYADGELAENAIQNSRNFYNFFKGSAGSVDLPLNTSYYNIDNNQTRVILYDKGRVFYDELERLVGRDAFMAGLKTYFAEFRYGVAQPVDILRHMEEASGEDLDAFFYEWVGNFEGLDQEVKAQIDAENMRTEEG